MKWKWKLGCLLLAVCMMICLLPGGALAAGSTTGTVQVTVTYGQTEARSMLSMINEFRQSDDAWYWNSSDSKKVTVTGLQNLTYDYDLEKVAMQRAAELAVSFSHTRPDGTLCWTASQSVSGFTASGENIACGYTSAAATFSGWTESSGSYSGQGHRRNMLSTSANVVAVGHVVYNGVHYWVQEFGYRISANTTATSANDSTTTVSVRVSSGSDDSTTTVTNPFTDVPSGEWYTDPVL